MHITQTITKNGRTAICVCSQQIDGGEWELSIITLAFGLENISGWNSPTLYKSSEAAMNAGIGWIEDRF